MVHHPALAVTRSQRRTYKDFVRQLFTYGRGRGEQSVCATRVEKMPQTGMDELDDGINMSFQFDDCRVAVSCSFTLYLFHGVGSRAFGLLAITSTVFTRFPASMNTTAL